MVIHNTSLAVCADAVCGQRFVPISESSALAVFERHGRVCGIFYESGRLYPFLRCCVGYQIPAFARDKRKWAKAMWQYDDVRMSQIRLDERDGELIYIYNEKVCPEDLSDIVEDILGFLLGDELHDAIVEFVRNQMG